MQKIGGILRAVRYILGASVFFGILFIVLTLASKWIVPVADYCLDTGGSYNYEACTCDYDNNHPNKKFHWCR